MEKYENIQEDITKDTNELAQTTQDRLAGMRKKADLSDIILEKEHSSHDKKKKFLLGAASLVLIFLIVLIITKMLNDSSTTQTINNDKDKNNTISSEIQKVADATTTATSAVITPVKDTVKTATNALLPTTKTDTKAKKIDTTNDTDLKFEEMVRKLKEQDAKENGSDTPSTNVVTSKKLIPVENKIKIKKIMPKKETSIKITSTPVAKPKTIIKKPKTTNIKVPSFKEFSVGKSGYYIQVGATTKPQPSSALVRKIKSNGFSYITHSIRVKGRTFNKILVGPFKSKNAANVKMGMVKATINSQAFLYHLR